MLLETSPNAVPFIYLDLGGVCVCNGKLIRQCFGLICQHKLGQRLEQLDDDVPLLHRVRLQLYCKHENLRDQVNRLGCSIGIYGKLWAAMRS